MTQITRKGGNLKRQTIGARHSGLSPAAASEATGHDHRQLLAAGSIKRSRRVTTLCVRGGAVGATASSPPSQALESSSSRRRQEGLFDAGAPRIGLSRKRRGRQRDARRQSTLREVQHPRQR